MSRFCKFKILIIRQQFFKSYKLQANCTQTLRDTQSVILSDSCASIKDVQFAFVIGGSDDFAMVMEVRGFSYEGLFYNKYNAFSYFITLIGEFTSMTPGEKILLI